MRAALAIVAVLAAGPAQAHDVYSNLYGKDKQLCCNGKQDGQTGDCAPAQARAVRGGVEFLIDGKEWVFVPADRVTFLPVPGEESQSLGPPMPGTIWGHFCGRKADETDRANRPESVFGDWRFFCAFYEPGGV